MNSFKPIFIHRCKNRKFSTQTLYRQVSSYRVSSRCTSMIIVCVCLCELKSNSSHHRLTKNLRCHKSRSSIVMSMCDKRKEKFHFHFIYKINKQSNVGLTLVTNCFWKIFILYWCNFFLYPTALHVQADVDVWPDLVVGQSIRIVKLFMYTATYKRNNGTSTTHHNTTFCLLPSSWP